MKAPVIRRKHLDSLPGPPRWSRSALHCGRHSYSKEQTAGAPLTRQAPTRSQVQTVETVSTRSTFFLPCLSPTRALTATTPGRKPAILL